MFYLFAISNNLDNIFDGIFLGAINRHGKGPGERALTFPPPTLEKNQSAPEFVRLLLTSCPADSQNDQTIFFFVWADRVVYMHVVCEI